MWNQYCLLDVKNYYRENFITGEFDFYIKYDDLYFSIIHWLSQTSPLNSMEKSENNKNFHNQKFSLNNVWREQKTQANII